MCCREDRRLTILGGAVLVRSSGRLNFRQNATLKRRSERKGNFYLRVFGKAQLHWANPVDEKEAKRDCRRENF